MASTVCVALLCLSVGVAAAASAMHAGLHGRDLSEGVMESVREALPPPDEGEEQTQSVSDASAVHGLTQLVHRVALFSHALNLSSSQQGESGVGGDSDVQRLREGVVELVRSMTLFSHALNLSSARQQQQDASTHHHDDEQRPVSEGLAQLVDRMTLFSHALNLSHGDSEGGSEQRVSQGLTELVQRMALLSKALAGDHLHYLPSSTAAAPPASPPAPTTTNATTTTATPEGEDRERPCVPPFEQIAYRMCILQEMQLRLSWSDAQEFCRERGADLAQDMTVIKARRFLNDLYGEEGTRTRWPVWVGGRRTEQQQTWKWTGFAGDLDVPSFMWAPGEPRAYSSDLMPEGVCMILDGYRRFHGASLPCHLRRRFVCELRN